MKVSYNNFLCSKGDNSNYFENEWLDCAAWTEIYAWVENDLESCLSRCEKTDAASIAEMFVLFKLHSTNYHE